MTAPDCQHQQQHQQSSTMLTTPPSTPPPPSSSSSSSSPFPPPASAGGATDLASIPVKDVVIVAFMLGLWLYSIMLIVRAWAKIHNLPDSAMNIGGNMWKFVMDYLHRKRGNGEEEDREEGEGEEGEAIAEGGGGEKEEASGGGRGGPHHRPAIEISVHDEAAAAAAAAQSKKRNSSASASSSLSSTTSKRSRNSKQAGKRCPPTTGEVSQEGVFLELDKEPEGDEVGGGDGGVGGQDNIGAPLVNGEQQQQQRDCRTSENCVPSLDLKKQHHQHERQCPDLQQQQEVQHHQQISPPHQEQLPPKLGPAPKAGLHQVEEQQQVPLEDCRSNGGASASSHSSSHSSRSLVTFVQQPQQHQPNHPQTSFEEGFSCLSGAAVGRMAVDTRVTSSPSSASGNVTVVSTAGGARQTRYETQM